MQPVGKFTREADFRRERDFGAKVGATFEFVVAQFKPLFKCIAYFVLPGALLGGIGLGLVMGNFMDLMPTAGKPSDAALSQATFITNGPSFMGMALAGIGFLTAFLLLSSVVYGFVRVRMSTPAHEPVQPARVWAFVWKRLGSVVGAWLLLGIVMVIGTGVLGGTLGLAGPGFVGLLFFPLVWVVVCMTLYFPVLMMEDNGVVAAFRRSFYLIKGKWWSSLGLYMVMSFITGIVNYLFIIPLYALMIGRTLLGSSLNSEILNIGAMTIYGMGWIFSATLPLVAMLFQYFNLVERKEGVGLRMMVDSLGLGTAPQVRSAAYQPDEEGEY